MQLVTIIFKIVGVSILIGAFAMAWVFVPDHGWGDGLWHAVFHAISAFNNAGFSTWSDSLSAYATHPVINLVVPGLFIIGGLGYVVLDDVLRIRRWRRFSLHTKLMLVGTAGLILISMPVWLAIEWNNPATLGGFDQVTDRLMIGWFQSVTPRTAGFNTIDTAGMRDSSTLLTMCLMVIGGGTTSTAGGIKVTTFVLLLLATRAFFSRQSEIQCFQRSIAFDQMLKVLALVTSSLLLIVSALFALVLTQSGDFLVLMFEAVSAFGTVGLSQGATGELDDIGRLIVCLLMFLGRVGPLMLGFFLATKVVPRVRYPSSPILLG